MRGPGPQMGVVLSLGSQMVRGWNAYGTRMERGFKIISMLERGWNADSKKYPYSWTMESPISFTLTHAGANVCEAQLLSLQMHIVDRRS